MNRLLYRRQDSNLQPLQSRWSIRPIGMLLYFFKVFLEKGAPVASHKGQPFFLLSAICFLPHLEFSRMNYRVPVLLLIPGMCIIFVKQADDHPYHQHSQYHFHVGLLFRAQKSPVIFLIDRALSLGYTIPYRSSHGLVVSSSFILHWAAKPLVAGT